MRDSNCRSAAGNRASVSISTTLYDRRALDCTSDRPLINSLNHLAYLTTSSARVRLTLCFDGGVERLVAILKECQGDFCKNQTAPCNRRDPALVAWKWSLALQCLLLLGTRGSELIRRRVVQAGIIPVIATVLDNYLELAKENRDKHVPSVHVCNDHNHRQELFGYDRASYNYTIRDSDGDLAEQTDLMNSVTSAASEISRESRFGFTHDETDQSFTGFNDPSESAMGGAGLGVRAGSVPSEVAEASFGEGGNVSFRDARGGEAPQLAHTHSPETNAFAHYYHGNVLAPRDEDVIWSLEILAYVSKYAYLKPKFQMTHLVPCLSVRDPTLPPLRRELTTIPEDEMEGISTSSGECSGLIVDCLRRLEVTKELKFDDYDFESTDDIDSEFCTEIMNVFQLVERLTARRSPREIPYWAGIVMRNSCRKDESRGGIRQCANFNCGKWEEYPRQFAKCRQCKRTKYCSKKCQLESWEFHRYWCAPSSNASSSSQSTTSNVANERPQSAGIQARTAAPLPGHAHANFVAGDAPATAAAAAADGGEQRRMPVPEQALRHQIHPMHSHVAAQMNDHVHSPAQNTTQQTSPQAQTRMQQVSPQPQATNANITSAQLVHGHTHASPSISSRQRSHAHQRQLSSEIMTQLGQPAGGEQWFSATAL